MKNIHLSHHICVKQTQTCQLPQPSNLPKTAWGGPGWGTSDNEWFAKVIGHPTLRKSHHPPTPEVSNLPNSNPCSSKHCTPFGNLPLDILHTIDTWNICFIHNDNFKKILEWLSKLNPILHYARSYKIKNSLFNEYMHDIVICYVWEDIRTNPNMFLCDCPWGLCTINHEAI